MMRKHVVLLLVVLVSVGLLVGSAGCDPSGEPAEGEMPKVVMAFTSEQPYLGHTPYFVADELGYWEEEGIEVEFEWTAGSSQAIQLLGSGKVDFTAANHDALIFANHKGANMKSVFQEHTKCEFQFAVPKNSPIKKLEDLKGKKIGVSSMASGFVPYAQAAFFEAGMDPEKDLNLLEVGSGSGAATAIESGEVDVLGLWEVAFANLENTLGHDYFRFITPPIYDRLTCNAIITTDEIVNDNPEVVIGFLRGLSKGTVFLLNNPDAVIDIFYKNYPEAKPPGKDDETILKEAQHVLECENEQRTNQNRPLENPMGLWGYQIAAEFLEAQNVHIRIGTLDKELPVDAFMTNDFIEEVNNFDEEAIINQAKEYTVD